MNVLEAISILDQVQFPLTIEKVRWEHALHRVLAEDIIADQDFPPFDRVMMDGFAFRYNDWISGKRQFLIDGFLGAGDDPSSFHTGECIEIMTGASIPSAFDCVIPIEKVIVTDNSIRIPDDYSPKEFHHIHLQGSDYKQGAVLIEKGTKVSALHIAVLTSCGYAEVSVAALPKIAIVSTGDELVDIEDTPLPYQIRMSNMPSLSLFFRDWSSQIQMFHWKDHYEEMSAKMSELTEFDVLIFTGGVSKGKKDFMPLIWQNSGFQKLIHGIQQKPGKPIWIGKNDHQILFGLPGNPVSALTCAMVYALPWIQKHLGMKRTEVTVDITSPIAANQQLDLLVPVVYHQGHWEILKNNGSGDLIGFSSAKGIVLIPKKSQDSPQQNRLLYFGG